jgi:UDP-GlcNAc:undecaprenyl-phosphate/decaprenyl-phosphate GlcNAc-1-phosphate transferase
VPFARAFAFRVGAIDAPGGRRVHVKPTARLGGLAIFVSFFATLAAMVGFQSGLAGRFVEHPELIYGLLIGGGLLVALGAVDDVRGVRAIHKLGIQIIAAGAAYAAGFRIEGIHLPVLGDVTLGALGVPLTILWIVGVVNALNLIDGLDGLAAGIALFACVTNYMVASLSEATGVMTVSAVLGGAILGFLVFNFNPATIFLGDSGSLFLGFVLATTSLLSTTGKSTTAVAILVPMLALGVPIIDTLFAMVRRLLERRPIFSPDRGHIHHRLLDLGITHRRAVLLLYGISAISALCAIALAAGRDAEVGVTLTALALVVVGAVRFIAAFQTRLVRERERMTMRSDLTERLRRTLPALIADLSRGASSAEMNRALARFAESSNLCRLSVHETEHSAAGFAWNGPSAPEATLELGVTDATVTFGLREPASMQDALLLQLAADAIEQRLLQARAEVLTTSDAVQLSPAS